MVSGWTGRGEGEKRQRRLDGIKGCRGAGEWQRAVYGKTEDGSDKLVGSDARVSQCVCVAIWRWEMFVWRRSGWREGRLVWSEKDWSGSRRMPRQVEAEFRSASDGGWALRQVDARRERDAGSKLTQSGENSTM